MAPNENRIYVGNLPPGIRSKDLQELFHKYGKILYIDVKNKRGPPFAFVEFDNIRDAEDAVYERDGYDFEGYKLRVEFPKGSARNRARYFQRTGGGSRDKSGGQRTGRRTNHRVIVTGLPSSGSWQDLKDHMREAGDVCYADVFKDGSGVVEFVRYEDMRYALKKLDDSRFKTHEGEVGYIRIKEGSDDYDRRGKSRSRSGSSSRSRSRSRSYPTNRRRNSPTYSPIRRSLS